MRPPLIRRLDALESGRAAGGFQIITVVGGTLSPSDYATSQGAAPVEWWRQAGEDAEQFRRRAEGEGRAAGLKILLFGGHALPNFSDPAP
jgi:hypothetical protein